jgi:uncharacterized protein (DUF1697 family)
MPKYAVLLRGVNVGRHAQLPMADLRRVLESLGHTAVSTYLRSGNAVITSPDRDPRRLARAIRTALADEASLDVAVMLRTGAELADIIKANPFPDALDAPAKLHVAFLSDQPDPTALAKLDPARYAPDEFRLGERVLYIWFPNGAGRSKLNAGALGRLGVDATARNWNTVLALADQTAS